MSSRAEQDQGQPSTRRPWVGFDQHGRKWGGSAEKNSGYPCGVIHPAGWSAPWLAPQGTSTYIFSKDNPSSFRINYEGLLEERLKDQAEHQKDRQRAAMVRGWDPMDPEKQEALDNLTQANTLVNRPEVIVACMQGDKWILGLTDKVNEKVQAFLPKKVDRKTALLKGFPDFTVQDEAEMEERLDLEEQFDAEATGGKKQKLPTKPKAKREAAA